jgi:multidrug efflux system outer membrane protein
VRGAVTTAFIGAGMLAACAGLPHKQPPVSLSAAAPLEGLTLEGGGAWPSAQWWKRYSDPTLDALIAAGVADSPSLASAHARFESAQASVRLAAAAAGARIDANADINRQRLSDNGLFPTRLLGFTWYNLADLGLQASYTFDWWNKQKYSVESAIDQAHAAQADRSAALLTLASSIADTYFGWQADQNRLLLARRKEEAVDQERSIAMARLEADLDSADNVDRADLSLGAAREEIAALEGSARLRQVALAALVGKSVADLPPFTVRDLPAVAGILPDNVKIDLIARRADITASRWRVEAAQKSLSEARAEFFPDVSINALLGVQSIDVNKLLEYGSRVPQIGAAIHLPIFDQGRLKAQYGAARASIDSAVSTYQDTVIGAARDVGTQVTMLAQIDAQRRQRHASIEAVLRLEEAAAARVRQGIDDQRVELTATETLIEQRDALLQLDAQALSADIALQRALGGGYDSAQLLTTTTTP